MLKKVPIRRPQAAGQQDTKKDLGRSSFAPLCEVVKGGITIREILSENVVKNEQFNWLNLASKRGLRVTSVDFM